MNTHKTLKTQETVNTLTIFRADRSTGIVPFILVVAFMLVGFLVGPTTLAQTTNIRVIHLSPDAPAVDVLVNESLRAVENLSFPS
ncbi:DUF4397 domain-containing protein, partial [bacterium]|nr:DUF4397 domain-containing protein [candidate division CSSED10-310 bacterium]